MKARAITLFTVLMAITACTEKVPIVPDYSGGNDWAPTIELTGQGYGRVSLSWEDTPAPSAVHRNIEQMVLEATENNLSVVFVDTILSVRGIPLGYESPAVFDAPRFYGVRVRVDYRGGVQRYSNVVQFYTRVVPGQVLKTFSLTPPPPFGNYFPSGIAFDNGTIYTMVGKTLIAIDTLDGRQLNLGIAHDVDRQDESEFRGILVHGDTLTLPVFPVESMNSAILRRQLISSGQVLSEVTIEAPSAGDVGQLVYRTADSTLFFWRGPRADSLSFSLYDSDSGQWRWTSPRGTSSEIIRTRNFIGIDGSVFGASALFYRYYIGQILPKELRLAPPTHTNPFFGGNIITFDGRHFWTISSHTSQLAKIVLGDI